MSDVPTKQMLDDPQMGNPYRHGDWLQYLSQAAQRRKRTRSRPVRRFCGGGAGSFIYSAAEVLKRPCSGRLRWLQTAFPRAEAGMDNIDEIFNVVSHATFLEGATDKEAMQIAELICAGLPLFRPHQQRHLETDGFELGTDVSVDGASTPLCIPDGPTWLQPLPVGNDLHEMRFCASSSTQFRARPTAQEVCSEVEGGWESEEAPTVQVKSVNKFHIGARAKKAAANVVANALANFSSAASAAKAAAVAPSQPKMHMLTTNFKTKKVPEKKTHYKPEKLTPVVACAVPTRVRAAVPFSDAGSAGPDARHPRNRNSRNRIHSRSRSRTTSQSAEMRSTLPASPDACSTQAAPRICQRGERSVSSGSSIEQATANVILDRDHSRRGRKSHCDHFKSTRRLLTWNRDQGNLASSRNPSRSRTKPQIFNHIPAHAALHSNINAPIQTVSATSADDGISPIQQAQVAAARRLQSVPVLTGAVRPGDWFCPICSAHNYASKFKCFRCVKGRNPLLGTGHSQLKIAAAATVGGGRRAFGIQSNMKGLYGQSWTRTSDLGKPF